MTLEVGEVTPFRTLVLRLRDAAATWDALVGLTDGDKGDITVSASGVTWTIDNNAVTDAKLRDSAAVSVIGRSANTGGDPADIAAAANGQLLGRLSDAVAFATLSAFLDAAVGSTQGMVLYRDATAWAALAAGTAGQALLSGGAGANPSWGAASTKNMTLQSFTVDGTWSRPTGCTKVLVVVLAPGGGGGGADNDSGIGAGGGAGSTAIALVDVSAISSKAVTVPAGGAGGSTTGGDGASGSAASWGTECAAGGGVGGTGVSAAAAPRGGAGGTATAGSILLRGQTGHPGWWVTNPGTYPQSEAGQGADSWAGGGGSGWVLASAAIPADATGDAATGYGAGGGGGYADSTTGRAGGAGAPGLCIVFEFYGSN